jgi:hypothetical protein
MSKQMRKRNYKNNINNSMERRPQKLVRHTHFLLFQLINRYVKQSFSTCV